jgi:hypothetical protein
VSQRSDAGRVSADTVVTELRIAQDALDHANRQRAVALEAVRDFALRAVVDGRDVETVMNACGFVETAADEDEQTHVMMSLLGGAMPFSAAPDRRARFAQWLSRELYRRVMTESEPA